MNEDFLHYVWKFQLLSFHDLKTTTKESLLILKPGIHNHNSGPDFLNAQMKIENHHWVGNVEIHLKSSDWYAHNHELDPSYDAVILHVVWEDDSTVFMRNNKPLPVLILKDFVLNTALNNYLNLYSAKQRWISCENEIYTIDSFIFENWKERLFFERLERKSNEMKEILFANKNDFEAVLFKLLAKSFGLKVNGDVFLSLANSFDFSILRRVRSDENKLTALLFGQSGFLEEKIEDIYHQQLKKEFHYLKHKYKLSSISNNQFSFFRMRPSNFPTIRIAQLISLYHLHQGLFSKLIKIQTLKGFYNLFNVNVNSFWNTHYTFHKNSSFSSKKLTKQFINLVLINTVIPLIFLYKRGRGDVNEHDFLDFFQKIKPEKNSIIYKFNDLKINSRSVLDTQALLELKNNYCAKKLCLQCAVGNHLLQR
jgi:hypothetical protein